MVINNINELRFLMQEALSLDEIPSTLLEEIQHYLTVELQERDLEEIDR